MSKDAECRPGQNRRAIWRNSLVVRTRFVWLERQELVQIRPSPLTSRPANRAASKSDADGRKMQSLWRSEVQREMGRGKGSSIRQRGRGQGRENTSNFIYSEPRFKGRNGWLMGILFLERRKHSTRNRDLIVTLLRRRREMTLQLSTTFLHCTGNSLQKKTLRQSACPTGSSKQ